VRLCEPIQGTDSAQIADCLGLDASKFQHIARSNQDEDGFFVPLSQVDAEDRYKDVDKLITVCPSCKRSEVHSTNLVTVCLHCK
jgi:DNA polymerase alpha subunit A